MEDWQRESAQMDKFYGDAELVLAAAVASSTCDGFLRDRDLNVGHVSFTPNVESGPIDSKYRLNAKHSYVEKPPLDSRAWAYEEKLLARRYLAYDKYEMRWTCCEYSFCECAWGVSMYGEVGWNLTKTQQTKAYAPMALWREAISRNYVKKILTVHSDKQVALSAVASRFHPKHGGTYLAGIWREYLALGLLWHIERGVPEDFNAPSWSWVSIHTSVTASTTNRFGPVFSGSIKLRGSLIEATLHFCNSKSSWVEPIKIKEFFVRLVMLDMPVVAFPTSNHVTGEAVISARRIHYTDGEPIGSVLTCIV
ncbi:hypothetical protein GGR53DRAFT_4354 [Hypoxylon sp. FL1150]|nr:hypothetical protein GGR53DRAFT_4354 [Hypoxylon sp. FL1150]